MHAPTAAFSLPTSGWIGAQTTHAATSLADRIESAAQINR